MNNQSNEQYKPLGERVAILETRFNDFNTKLETISAQLDSLLTLKDKGMGALGLVSLLVGSGIVGLLFTLMQFFRPHL